MTKREEYESKTEQLLQPILDENHFELVDIEFVKEAGTFYLRAFIDKEGGITINDCEMVSRRLSDLLDVHDFIPDAYILEVSSPGLGRQLKKDKDFKRSIGEEVEIKLYQPMELGAKRKKLKEFEGVLEEFDADTIKVSMDSEELIAIDRSNIAIIKLAVHF